MLRLLIADDHRLFRHGLRQLCEVNGGFTVVAEAENGQQAVELARKHSPDVILMDIRMAGMTGVEATRQIMQAHVPRRILVLTMFREDAYVREALRAGATGYLLKNCSEETLFAAIRAVHQGDGWIDAPVAKSVLTHFAETPGQLNDSDNLSAVELEILRLVARGAENQTIADRLNLAKSTVANYLRDIFAKLNVSNRTEAALYAVRHGLAPLDLED